MSTRKVYHCVVDDTTLVPNFSEVQKWLEQGAITLIVPLYTLERLNAVQKHASQFGENATKAVLFLDKVTSGNDPKVPIERVTLQGPMELYEKWTEAEKYLQSDFHETKQGDEEPAEQVHMEEQNNTHEETVQSKISTPPPASVNPLSQALLDKLNFKKEPDVVSTTSVDTPPLSPSTPESRSSKTSPEVTAAKLARAGITADQGTTEGSEVLSTPPNGSIVPAAVKPLLNATLWRIHNTADTSDTMTNCILVTNNDKTLKLAQKFGIPTKNVHQLRAAIIYEEKDSINRSKYLEKNKPSHAHSSSAPKATLNYEADSDDEELVFKPRASRGNRAAVRGNGSAHVAPKENHRPSTATSATPTKAVEVPSEPIDPDSFDRGSAYTRSRPAPSTARGFGGRGRGSAFANARFTPSPSPSPQTAGPSRGSFSPIPPRGGFQTTPPRGPAAFNRGRGGLRHPTRGGGRLFVP